VGLTVIMASVAVLAILSYMGTPHYAVSSSPDQEVVAELLPQTHPGVLRTSNWADLTVGTWQASEWEASPTPTLRNLLHIYEEEMALARDNPKCRAADPPNCLTNGEGYMIVEEWQPGLKRITFRIIWGQGLNNAEACAPAAKDEFCQTAYFHERANYGQGE
jgi:hypothetical protein